MLLLLLLLLLKQLLHRRCNDVVAKSSDDVISQSHAFELPKSRIEIESKSIRSCNHCRNDVRCSPSYITFNFYGCKRRFHWTIQRTAAGL